MNKAIKKANPIFNSAHSCITTTVKKYHCMPLRSNQLMTETFEITTL
jgi:hypothetical protein